MSLNEKWNLYSKLYPSPVSKGETGSRFISNRYFRNNDLGQQVTRELVRDYASGLFKENEDSKVISMEEEKAAQ